MREDGRAGRRRCGVVRGPRDLALEGAPVVSHTLYGTEVPASVIRARMLATPRIVAVRHPHVRGARITVFARAGRC
ncbi:hypothetical protein [Streptomyces sp. R35]|uniref:Uncharacterized protein n=1 Tax=Streptomyces sp. R35 TaxID=3238630 RepID=A0AB39SJ79_9ACTN